MPKKADFVVIQENTRIEGGFMYLDYFDKKSPYVRKTGLDFKKGQKISYPTLIDYKLVSALASLNVEKVFVLKKPRVYIIPTGNEILALGSKAKKNSISGNFNHTSLGNAPRWHGAYTMHPGGPPERPTRGAHP